MNPGRVRSPLLPATKSINDSALLFGALTVFVVSLVWLIAWKVRGQVAEPNVDDYLYTIVARQIWAPLASGDVWATVKAILGTGQNAPLVPTLASPLSTFGPDVAVIVQLPLLLALAVLVFSIVRRVSGTAVGVVAALVTSLSAPILNWSLMVHMALASSACSLGVLDAFLRSDGFTHRRASIAVGIWIGLLAVSRSMAPVYVSMICVTVALSTVVFHRRKVIGALPRIALAGVAAIGIAGPWYAVSGLTALRYLSTTGYGSTSGFIDNASSLIVRYRTTMGDLGYGLAATIAAMCVAILIERRHHDAEGRLPALARESPFVLLVFAALVMTFLSTSRTPGTAFDLPAIAALIPGLFVLLRQRSSLVLIAPFALASISLAVVQAWLLPGWETRASISPPPTYATGGASALGAYGLRVPHIAERINSMVGDRSVFVTRDDPILNVNALTYLKLARGFGGSVITPSYDQTVTRFPVPADNDFVISGQSCNPYHRNVDRRFLEEQLARQGWARALALQLSSCNEIVLWERATLISAELFARLTSKEAGDGFGRVELHGQEILIHPGDTQPTLASFDVSGLPSPLRLHLKIGALDEAGQRVPEAGNVNVEVQLDKVVLFTALVDRRTAIDRAIDVSRGRELVVRVDNANGKAWWDWFMLSATTDR